MKNRNIVLRVLAALCGVWLLGTSLCACGAEKDTVKAKTVVGTVDGRDVYYDELYFLVSNYMDSAKDAYGEDGSALSAELDRLFRENVIRTYAMLRLCEDHGLTYKESDWKDEINAAVSSEIEDTAGGDEDAYYAYMEKTGKTKRLLRYYFGTETFYNQLLSVYPEQGLVCDQEADLIRIFREQFIRVYHLAVFDDGVTSPNATPEKLAEAQEKLKNGETTMYQLIKHGYTEDISDSAADGWHLIRGTMNEAYEEAAFSLAVGEVSDVIAAKGIGNTGDYVDCYYVIQRFEMDDAYINDHFDEMREDYYGSVIAADLEEVEKTLAFTPNDYYETLDLTQLKKPHETSRTWVIVLSVGGGTLAVAAAVVVPVLLLKKKHRKKNIAALPPKRRNHHDAP